MRALRIALCLAGLLGPALRAASDPSAPLGGPRDASWARDPVLVFYARSDCRGERIELEVYDRELGIWREHPAHPRVPVDTCQVEDAGRLWNEIRWRCEEPPGSEPPSLWSVGLDVFDPRVMEQCAVGRREAETGLELHVERPSRGETVRNPTMEVAIEGSVRLNGLAGDDYDVVLALDRSEETRRDGVDVLTPELRAARAFVEALRPRLGDVRVGIVSYPNLPPIPSDGGTGARREIALGDDFAALAASLDALGARGASGFSTFLSAFEYGLRELDPARRRGARPQARKVLVLLTSARGRLPLGPGAHQDPAFGARLSALAQQARERGVTLHVVALAGVVDATPESVASALRESGGTLHRVALPALETPFLGGVPLPEVREVSIENRTAKLAPRAARIDRSGRFALTLPAAPGPNRLRLRATLSDGAQTSREWEFRFDDSWVKERLLAAEAERLRRARQQKRLQLDPQWNESAPAGGDAPATPEE
jgi:hypothetical protein